MRFVCLIILASIVLPWASTQATGAQEATPAAALTLPTWAETWITSQEAEDITAFADLYAPDATYEVVGSDIAVHDVLSIREVLGMFAVHQDDVQITPLAFYEGDGWAVLEWTISATEVLSPDDEFTDLPMTDIRTATIFELGEDGLIQRSTDYPDGLTAAIQLGHVATPVPE